MKIEAQVCSFSLSVDRVEDEWAVLLADDGKSFDVPRGLLPSEAVEGSRLDCSMALQNHESASTREMIQSQLDKLTDGDDGADIVL